MKRIVVAIILGMSCMLCKAQSNALSEREWSPLMGKAMEWVDQNLNNGSYKGQLSNGSRSGLGVYRWSNGSWYWGRWRNGDMNGMAIYIVPDGYEVANCPDCVYYVGNYYSDKKSGTGTCYDEYGKLIYHGNFSDDRPTDTYPSTGYAGYEFECIAYSGGDMYIGETNNGTRHGYGIYLWSNGQAWYFPWKDGDWTGYGIMLSYKGNSQAGRWMDGAFTEVEQACRACGGKGNTFCTVCSGTGRVAIYTTSMQCGACLGRGRRSCIICSGSGKVTVGSTADEVFRKVRTRYASAGSGSYGESSSSGESDNEIWDRATAYYKAGDYAKAVPLYRQLADQGHADAQFNLGNGYYKGEGVEKSYSEAVRWYRKAAEQGDAVAQFNLGVCYENGRGVEKSYSEAVRWYRKAADQGDADAMLNLGNAYDFGEGVEKNGNKALYWYKKGLKNGNVGSVRQRLTEAFIVRLEKMGYSADRAGIR